MKDKKPLNAMKAVYTYFFPEVRELVHTFDDLPSELFLTSTSVKQAQEIIDKYNWKTPFVVPSTPQGYIDLDMIHIPVIEKVIEAYKTTIPSLKDFPYVYFTSGSSEGIFHVLAELKAKGLKSITSFKSEYEGYKEYSKTLGIRTEEIRREKISKLEKGIWFISNPSAIDGNIIEDKNIIDLANQGNEIHLDLAYVGSTQDHVYDVSHENIKTVFLSLSKPYGVFRFRMGFTFSREPIDSLYGNKWFKDIGRTLTAAKIVEEIVPSKLHRLYNEKQKQIVEKINDDYGIGLEVSDALLLGNILNSQELDRSQKTLLRPYKRGDGYRLCLTPYYEELEKLKSPLRGDIK